MSNEEIKEEIKTENEDVNIEDSIVCGHNSDDKNSEELMDEPTEEERIYAEAVEDFASRLIVIEVPNESKAEFTKYTKSIQGISCSLGITNQENHTVAPLRDDFESPFDEISTWAVAVRNCVDLSSVDEETSKPEGNIYVVLTACGRAIVCCDEFWDSVCEKYNVMRLIVSLYYKPDDEGPMVAASLVKDSDKLSTKAILNDANKNGQYRTSLVYVKGVGMISEAALNSEI